MWFGWERTFTKQMWLLGHELPQLRDLLVHNAAFDRHQGIVDFDEVILAVLFQMYCIKAKFDDVVGVCPQLPLHEGLGGIGIVGEARSLNPSNVIGLRMLRKLKKSWSRIKNKTLFSCGEPCWLQKIILPDVNHLRLNEEEVNRESRADQKKKKIHLRNKKSTTWQREAATTQHDWHVSRSDCTWRHDIIKQQGVACSHYAPLLLVHKLVHHSHGFVYGGLLACRDVELGQVVGNNATFAERCQIGRGRRD